MIELQHITLLIQTVEIVTIVLQFFLCGFFVAWFSKKIDTYLNYGEIFGEVRFFIVKKFVKKLGLNDSKFSQILDIKSYAGKDSAFNERQKEMSKAYWEIAFFSKWLTPFICVKCMSQYVSILLTTVLFFAFKSSFDYSIYMWFVFLFFNSITTDYYLWRSQK